MKAHTSVNEAYMPVRRGSGVQLLEAAHALLAESRFPDPPDLRVRLPLLAVSPLPLLAVSPLPL